VFKVAPDILLEAWALNLASFLEIKVPKFTVLDDLEDLVECLERTNSPEKFAIIRSKLRHFSYSNMMVMELIDSTSYKLQDLKHEKNLFQLGQVLALDVFLYNADGYALHDFVLLCSTTQKTTFFFPRTEYHAACFTLLETRITFSSPKRHHKIFISSIDRCPQ
jgi:hypothetical protein